MTEFEFDYELALRNAWIEFLKEDNDTDPVEFVQNGDKAEFTKGLSTDPLIYQEVKKRAEAGEFIDFKLPDFSNAPTLKTKLTKMRKTEVKEQQESSDEYEAVDPADVFGGGLDA